MSKVTNTRFSDTKPWHCQFWPWFLIASQLVVIVACFYTFYVATYNPLNLVKDDYYKDGLAINQDQHRYKNAEDLHISAHIHLEGQKILCQLERGSAEGQAELLFLQFVHPLDSKKDIHLLLLNLQSQNKNFNYQSEALEPAILSALLAEKRWYVYLEPNVNKGTSAWALQGDFAITESIDILLGQL